LILPDVNVLVYAFRSDAAEHVRYRNWLEDVVNAQQAYGIAPQVLASVVRVTTHPKIFAHPSSPAEAFAFCRALLEQPNATVIVPGERHWGIFQTLCDTAAATGNLVQDAWFGALAMESGCEWVSTDRDFARFPDLVWRTPW
jgi:uncharacterized protein